MVVFLACTGSAQTGTTQGRTWSGCQMSVGATSILVTFRTFLPPYPCLRCLHQHSRRWTPILRDGTPPAAVERPTTPVC